MAILFESSTPIECLVRDALIKENIDFQEQYRIYTGGVFSEVKYVADFFLVNGTKRLIVECDGFRYHAGKNNYKKQLERDSWLKKRGYIVLHFTTKSIVSNMPGVIQTIKYHLNFPSDDSKTIKKEYGSKVVTYDSEKSHNNDFFDVNLYCYYRQFHNGVCVTYKYKYNSRNICSEERIKLCYNVPEDMLETTAIYLALLDLKHSVRVKIYYSGMLYNDCFNVSKKFRRLIKGLKKGKEILETQSISMAYVGFHGNYRFSKKESQKTMNELRSRCIQISNNIEKHTENLIVEYSEIINMT